MIWIGIDPGAKGGFCIMTESETGKTVHAYAWDDQLFIGQMRLLAHSFKPPEGHMIAAVEKVGAMPGNGSVSMFRFGQSYGFILGVLEGLTIPYQVVPPKEWKKEFGLNSDKAKSIEVCHRLFPDLDLKRTERCRTDSDGKAEATLICEWGRRHL